MRSLFGRLKYLFVMILALFVISVPAQTFAADETGSFWVEYIDVGQGDCALIQCDGHYMMIDGGPTSASSIVYTVLKNKGIDNLDVIIATHPDEDHIGGLSGALNYASADICYSSVAAYDSSSFQNLEKYLDKQGTELIVPTAGDEFTIGSADVKILGPITSYGGDTNNDSIVAKVTYGENTFLFMGDAEKEEEYSLVRSKANLTCDVLKVGHHGSSSSTTTYLLSKAKPQYAVISVGADNTYGHPTSQTLKRLESRKVTIYRTDLEGDIIFSSDGKSITVTTEKAADSKEILTVGSSGDSAESVTRAAPDGTTYVLNTSSKKFHLPGCSSVNDMSIKNRKDVTATRDEIIAQGYEPCKRCKP